MNIANMLIRRYLQNCFIWKCMFFYVAVTAASLIIISDFKLKIKMPRQFSFAYRRRNPHMFPHFCDTCVPQRRFMLPSHKEQHDHDKHGISISTTPHCFEYSLPRLLPSFGLSASSSSLSSITAGELNTFVLKEIEPDTAYNQSCRAVVDRLCRFMQNNFPDQLRPSEVIKVKLYL